MNVRPRHTNQEDDDGSARHARKPSIREQTSSGATGRWFVFRSSSIVLGSRRRSFLHPTRIIGKSGQKCITSEIHCEAKSKDGADRISGAILRVSNHVSETGAHLLLHVIKRIGAVNGETDKDDMRVRVTEWAEAIVIFLASSIPKSKFDALAINFDIRYVVLKDGRDINLLKESHGGHAPDWNVDECSVFATGGSEAVNDV